MQSVALLGLGTMGAGMAANWLAKGFALSVWNRTISKADALAAKGAKVAKSPREAAAGADFIFAMVADDAASRAVWLGFDGALAGAKSGAIALESSTLTPGWVGDLARRAREKHLRFLDAPVGGSRSAAASGALMFFIGGDAAAVEAVRPALEAVGGKINHLGPVGSGVTWKLINNQLIGAQTAALAEAANLARKAGFKPEQIAALISDSSAASPIVKAKLDRMLEHNYEDTDFALYLMLKDVRYAIDLAATLGAKADMSAAAAAAFARAKAKGLGDKDFAAVAAA